MVARTAVYPKLSTEPVFTKLTTQSTDVTEAAPTFTTIDLTVRDYAFYIGFSHSFVQDNIIGLGQFMADRTAGALAKKIDNELLRSSSSPTGLLNSTSAQVVRMTGPNFQDISEGDLVDMITALDQVQERDGACWIMHPQLLDTVMRIQNAQGDFIFREAQVLTKGWTRQILGYPVVLSNQMPRLSESTANTAFIALGNPKLFLYGDREAMSIRWLDRTSYFATNLEELYVAYFRAAMAISMEDSFCLLKTAA
jgi:HK97 family phage major capsid protein